MTVFDLSDPLVLEAAREVDALVPACPISRRFVRMPSGWEKLADRFGVPREAYIRIYAEQHPKDVR